MVKHCCAFACNSRDDGRSGELSFHVFPKDRDLRQKWIKAICRLEPDNPLPTVWKPSSEHVYICSKHFLPSDYAATKKLRRLRRTAVPSVFAFKKKKEDTISDRGKRYDESYLKLSVLKDRNTSREEKLEERIRTYRGKLRNVSKREKRLRKTVAHLTEELQEARLMNLELKEKLRIFKDIPIELFKKEHHAYSDRMRKFALTLSLYGSKAYEYCRSVIPLPHPVTLRRWLTGYSGRPGFSSESFSYLKEKSSGKDAWLYKCCSVMVDGMKIKKYSEYDQVLKRHVGLVNYGGALDKDGETEATEALVIMAVGVHGHWKIPLGYFLINGISATSQEQLLIHAFEMLHDAGVSAVSLTLDGHQTNMATIRRLGCSTKPENIGNSFPHPSTGKPVYVFIDACHALKLVRNQFAALENIEIPFSGTARWSHLTELNAFQKEKLTAANRLTDRHIEFYQQKMKVALAAQTLSASVAKGLQLLVDLRISGFRDASPTIQFIQMVDRAFDTLNSRTPFSKGFKAPITRENFEEVKTFAHDLECFFLSLEDDDGNVIVHTRKSTGFIGFIFCLRSFVAIARDLWREDSVKYVLAYKFSQDHLELFFNAIRRACGWNNNPTSMQFLNIYKRMLARAGAPPSNSGNCVNFDKDVSDNLIEDLEEDIDECHLSRFVVNVVAYMSGFVVRKVLPRLSCSMCRLALVSTSTNELDSSDRHLLRLKQNGGLVVPSCDVIKLLKLVESLYRSVSTNGYKLASVVLHEVVYTNIFAHSHFTTVPDHFISVVQSIVLCFIDIRGHHVARTRNASKQSKRYRLNKQILFEST